MARRGIPVLDNIQLGLQKIKNVLTGEEGPTNVLSQSVVGSRLMYVNGNEFSIFGSYVFLINLVLSNDRMIEFQLTKIVVA